MTTPEQDYADFQAWKAARDAGVAADQAARLSFSDVLHKLINAAPWNHTAERDQAHAAVDREYPTEGETAAPPAPPDVTGTPGANFDQGIAAGTNG